MLKYARSLVSISAIFLVGLASAALAADSPQFRGPDRSGIFPAEGLLASWPEAGPTKLWTAAGLGMGFASVSVADGRIYTTGMADGKGSVFALDTHGKRQWTADYGAVHDGGGYPGTRTTPTYHDGMLYILTSLGKAMALDAKTGETRWEVDLVRTYRGRNIRWGFTESPLVVDDKVVYTPGNTSTVIALDRKTGELAWSTSGLRDMSAYCSPRLFDDGKRRQIVTMVQRHMVGIDPADGGILWQQDYPGRWDIHAVSPVFEGSLIYVSDGYGQGGKMFELAADGKSVKLVWEDSDLDIHHGGAVMTGGRIYGAADNGTWYALDAKTGEVQGEIRRLGKGSVVYADGRLYGYTERGDVLLVDPVSFEVVGRFKNTDGDGQHWSHPVIADGVLYLRHGDTLTAFDLKQ